MPGGVSSPASASDRWPASAASAASETPTNRDRSRAAARSSDAGSAR